MRETNRPAAAPIEIAGAFTAKHVGTWFVVFRPPPKLTLSQWALENAQLDDGTRYRAFPFQRDIMDAFTEPGIRQITVMKGARVGYSKIVQNYLGYAIAHRPKRIVVYQPTIDDAEDYGKDEVAQVLKIPAVRRVIGDKAKRGHNTVRSKFFPGGNLRIKGANSPKEFRRITADDVILEEPDGYPPVAGQEGDQAELAFKRNLTSDDPLKVAGGTPTIKKASKTEALFEQSTQEYRYVPCPSCGTMQVLVWGDGTGPGIRWEPKEAPTKAWYVCQQGCVIEEDHKADMDEAGEFRPHKPENWPHRGFHIWAAYSQFPNACWLELAKELIRVRKDPNKLRVFVNQTLGETFEVKGDAPEWRRLYDRRESYRPGIVPWGGLLLTAGIDVQKDRIEIFVWAWGRDLQCWLVDHIVIPGSPFETKTWEPVSEAVRRKWQHESGVELSLAKVGADVGYATSHVEKWTRKHRGLVIPVKGATSLNAPAFAWSSVREAKAGGGTRKRGMRHGMVGGHTLTLELYGLMHLDPPTAEQEAEGIGHPPGYVHLNGTATDEVCKQLVGDQWVEKTGQWKQVHATEALDGWKYARAVGVAMGIDRWSPSAWAQLEAALPKKKDEAPPAPKKKDAPAPPAKAQPTPPQANAVRRSATRRTVVPASF